MKVEFYKDAEHEHRWHILAGNNEIVAASSEGFTSRSACRRNLRLTAAAILRDQCMTVASDCLARDLEAG